MPRVPHQRHQYARPAAYGPGDRNRPKLDPGDTADDVSGHKPEPGYGFGPEYGAEPEHEAGPEYEAAYETTPEHGTGPTERELAPSPGAQPASADTQVPQYDHATLKSLLGAWALTACPSEESTAVEMHLADCASCAEEALRLREAVTLLHREEPLDLDPLLRARVLEACLGRRPARIPVPEWAGPYGAEAARLDALLRDLGDGYWTTPVELRWYQREPMEREFTVSQVIAHLTAVDSLVGRMLGLPGPVAGGMADLGGRADGGRRGEVRFARARFRGARGVMELPLDPRRRTAAHWAAHGRLPGAMLRSAWREQSHQLVRTVSFAGSGAAGLAVDYGSFSLPLRDALVDRAFECWMHAGDIAEAVDYPYAPPSPRILHRMVDLAARMLPTSLANRRRAGLTAWRSRLLPVGAPGRSLKLEIEGDGGGLWYLPLDSPGAQASKEDVVAQIVLDSLEFCQLAAGHVLPKEAAVGWHGDRAAICDVLYAMASLSRM